MEHTPKPGTQQWQQFSNKIGRESIAGGWSLTLFCPHSKARWSWNVGHISLSKWTAYYTHSSEWRLPSAVFIQDTVLPSAGMNLLSEPTKKRAQSFQEMLNPWHHFPRCDSPVDLILTMSNISRCCPRKGMLYHLFAVYSVQWKCFQGISYSEFIREPPTQQVYASNHKAVCHCPTAAGVAFFMLSQDNDSEELPYNSFPRTNGSNSLVSSPVCYMALLLSQWFNV